MPIYEFLPTALEYFQSTGDQVDLVLFAIDQMLGRRTAAQIYPTAVEFMMSRESATNTQGTHVVCEIYPLRRIIRVCEDTPIQIARVYANGGGIITSPQARNIAPGIYIDDRNKDMIVTKGICGISGEGNEWLMRANAEVLKIADIISIAREALPQPIFEEFESFF